MNTTTKVILGITVAAAAGAAIGMLLAPEKGSDLRKKIKDGAKDWMDNFSDLLNSGKELAVDFQDSFLELKDDARELTKTENSDSKK